MSKPNDEVTKFLDGLVLPLRRGIEQLRKLILQEVDDLSENIKWNGPNYFINGQDRITMKIYPTHQIQLIFHRGAKKLEQPEDKIIGSTSKLLKWRENDRAIISFKSLSEIESGSEELKVIVSEWIEKTK